MVKWLRLEKSEPSLGDLLGSIPSTYGSDGDEEFDTVCASLFWLKGMLDTIAR